MSAVYSPAPTPFDNEAAAFLVADAGLQRLARALELGEGFQFLVLVTETPREAERALRALEMRMSHVLSRSMRIARFRPAVTTAEVPLAFTALGSEFQHWIADVQTGTSARSKLGGS